MIRSNQSLSYFILLAISFILSACQRAEVVSNESTSVKVTVSNGCPLDTKTEDDSFSSYTVRADKADMSVEFYVIDQIVGSDLIETKTFLEDGTQLSTGVVYHGKLVAYDVVYDVLDLLEKEPVGKLSSWWQSFKACVVLKANEMHENISSNPIDRATCEWAPCETIILALSAFDCLVNK